MNLIPWSFRVLEPEDSVSGSNLSAGDSERSQQVQSSASSGQKKNPLILNALPTGGMKSPRTGAPSVYQSRDSFETINAWLDAIARDDRRDR